MRVITWNVNSIRTRLPRLVALLERHEPDVLCLQELKVEDDKFPWIDIQRAGYSVEIFGQKTYNGVAILSKVPADSVQRGFDDGVDDTQARFIQVGFGSAMRVLCAYVPNGKTVHSESWDYKLRWYERLRGHLEGMRNTEPVILCGDFNIAPDDRDVRNPERWQASVLCHPDGRRALGRIAEWGLVDAFRVSHPEGGIYSWWDYRMLGFPKNDGLRIDLLYVSEPLVERIQDGWVDRDERKGKQPSDHAPVVLDLAD